MKQKPSTIGRSARRGRWRRQLALGVVAAVAIVGSGVPAVAVDNYSGEPSEAEASVIDSSILGVDLAGGGRSVAGSVSNPGSQQ